MYNSSRSSTPPNQLNSNLNMAHSSSSTLSTSPNSTLSPSSSSSNSRTSYAPSLSKQPETVICDNYSESNDLTATATSNIQLNCTDDLTTQVDYYLNEVSFSFIFSSAIIDNLYQYVDYDYWKINLINLKRRIKINLNLLK